METQGENPLGEKIDPGLVPSVPPGIAFRIIEKEAVIVHPVKGMVYALNSTGSFAWQYFNGEKSIREIAETIQHAYQVNYTDAERDLCELIHELSTRGLITLSFPNE